ncbi:MAG: hypothetical protein FJ149_12455 [Euryarchaeota archaeon]|nr:hypothetical protein [Euryarchaeota archaeon]
MDELEPVLRKFVRTMATLDIPYVIVGGFAVAGWGRPRATMDVDVIMQLGEADVPRIVTALRDGGFSIESEDIHDALRRKEHFSIFNSDTIFHIDAKGVYGKKEARTLQSRITVKFADYEIPISGLEDTIANKLRFGREQDLEDALALIIANRAALKMDVLQALCGDYGLLKELRALVRKADSRLARETGPDRQR